MGLKRIDWLIKEKNNTRGLIKGKNTRGNISQHCGHMGLKGETYGDCGVIFFKGLAWE